MNKIKYHRDHTITFWSVYQQIWICRCSDISDKELAAMTEKEREKIIKHLRKG